MLANMPHSAGARVATQLFRLTAKENLKSTTRMCVFVVMRLTGLITGKDAFFFFNGVNALSLTSVLWAVAIFASLSPSSAICWTLSLNFGNLSCTSPHIPLTLIDLFGTYSPGSPLELQGTVFLFALWSHADWQEVKGSQPAFHPIPTSHSQVYGKCSPSSSPGELLSLPAISFLEREAKQVLHTITNFKWWKHLIDCLYGVHYCNCFIEIDRKVFVRNF